MVRGTLPDCRNRFWDAANPASALNPGNIICSPFVGRSYLTVAAAAGASQHSVHVDRPSQPQWTVKQHGQLHQLYWGTIAEGSLEREATRPPYAPPLAWAASAVKPGSLGGLDVSSTSDICSARGTRKHALRIPGR